MTEARSVQAFEIAESSMLQMDSTASSIIRPAEPDDGVDPNGVVPADIVRFLARLRLLEGVPFSYLVPESDLLPPESIRFFYLDRNWTDALMQGALSVGTVNSSDRAKLEPLHGIVRSETDTAERLVRVKDADRAALDAEGRPIGAGGDITGFLLRSQIVSGWPGLHVRAYATDDGDDDAVVPDGEDRPDRVRLLRMERLAPAVLLVLFDGVPAVVHLEEPRSGIQFGVRNDVSGGRVSSTMRLRDVAEPNNGFLTEDGSDEIKVRTVPFRRGAPGVINLAALENLVTGDPRTNTGDTIESDELAIQMLRFPARQVFGDTGTGGTGSVDAFRPTISVERMAERYQLGAAHVRRRDFEP